MPTGSSPRRSGSKTARTKPQTEYALSPITTANSRSLPAGPAGEDDEAARLIRGHASDSERQAERERAHRRVEHAPDHIAGAFEDLEPWVGRGALRDSPGASGDVVSACHLLR